MYITLEQAKKQLQIDDSFSGDDTYILSLIQVAEDAVSQHLDRPLEDCLDNEILAPSVTHSILLLIGQLYANREPTAYSSVNKVPYTLDYLVGLNKHYFIP